MAKFVQLATARLEKYAHKDPQLEVYVGGEQQKCLI
jgi:hypothetical protein